MKGLVLARDRMGGAPGSSIYHYSCARVSFISFIKKETLPQMFSFEFCEVFNNAFFLRTWFRGCFCAPLPTINNSKAFLMDFYY